MGKTYRCEYCGNLFDPVKHGICPSCGGAVPPAVMTQLEREQAAARKRAEAPRAEAPREEAPRPAPSPAPRPKPAGRPGHRFTTPLIALFIGCILVFILCVAVLVRFRQSALFDPFRLVREYVSTELPTEVRTEAQETYDEFRVWGLGETATCPGYAVTILGFRDYDLAGYEKMNLPEGVRVIALEVRVENTSQEVAPVLEFWGWCDTDEEGLLDCEEHAPNDEARKDRLYSGSLYPGHDASGCIYLEVPEEARQLTLYYLGGLEFSLKLP